MTQTQTTITVRIAELANTIALQAEAVATHEWGSVNEYKTAIKRVAENAQTLVAWAEHCTILP